MLIGVNSYVCTLDLLFQKSGSGLTGLEQKIKLLKLLKLIFIESANAILAYQRQEYIKFDAQVGENICQARACLFLDLTNNKFNLNAGHLNDALKQMLSCKINLEKLLNEYLAMEINNNLLKACQYSKVDIIENFIIWNRLNFKIKKTIFIIIQCYLLTEFCMRDENNIPLKMDLNRLMGECGLLKHFAKRLIHCYQKTISEFSTEYTHMLSASICEDSFSKMLLLLDGRSDENRRVLPCYEGMKVFFKNMLKNNYPIVFIIKRFNPDLIYRFSLLFFPDENKIKYMLVSNLSICNLTSKTCMVIEGYAKYKNSRSGLAENYIRTFISIGVQNVVIFNMAKHPQYTGKKLSHLKENSFRNILNRDPSESKYLKYKQAELFLKQKLAELNGCCESKFGSVFCLIKHIYCDDIRKWCDAINSCVLHPDLSFYCNMYGKEIG